MANWGTGNIVGAVYLLSDADNKKYGSHWFKGRIIDGDAALCVEHAGDCFYRYKLLQLHASSLRVYPDSPDLCGYCLGVRSPEELTAREYHLLMAGEYVELDTTGERLKRLRVPMAKPPEQGGAE